MKRTLLFFLNIALFLSCEQIELIDTPFNEDIVTEGEVARSQLPEVIYAYAANDEKESQTRTFVDGTKVLWNNGDNIFYCVDNIIGAEYRYEGEDGAAKATFNKISDGKIVENGKNDFPVAVFPYRNYFDAKFNSNNIEDETDDTWTITPDFEQYQNYVPNSFDKDANIMIAVDKGADNNLSFRNACGYVVIKLYGINVIVNEVHLYANYESDVSIPRIWGKLYNIEVDSEGTLDYSPNKLNYSPWQQMVALNCIDSKTQQGVRVSEDKNNPTEFWFALPPVLLDKGFYLKVIDSNNNYVGKETTKSFEIERNKVKSMAAVDVSNPKRTCRLWYKTATTDIYQGLTKFENTAEWDSYKYFDAKIINHHWDNSPNGYKMFYIEFDRPITEIKKEAFMNAGVTEIILPEALTTIGESAFASNADLTTLTIPGRVAHIGQNAFAECANLTSVTFEPSNTDAQMTIAKGAFQESGLTSLSIPNRVDVIEQEAFADCESLTGMTFEASNTPLKIGSLNASVDGDHPFYDSNNIKTLTLNRELVKAHNNVPMDLFENNTTLTYVTLGEQVKTIHGEMFNNTGITQLSIPGTVTRIEQNAFANCENLTKVDFLPSKTETPLTIDSPNKTYLDNEYNPFYDSNNIHTLNLNRQLVKAHKYVSMALFEDHTALTFVTLGEQVDTIHYHMFYKAGSNIDKITIPSSVKSIETGAFRECKVSMIEIKESSDKTTPRIIGGSAFQDCTLTSITIPEGITTIDPCAFWKCSQLSSITIPGTVSEIGWSAFYGCTSLKTVVFNQGKTPLTIDYIEENNASFWQSEVGPFYESPLTSIYLDRDIVMKDRYAADLDSVNEGIFSYNDYENHQTTLTLGEHVTKIQPYMFAGSAITSVAVPANVTEIGYNAFLYCTRLATVNIEDSSTPLTLGYIEWGALSAEYGPFYDSPLSSITLKRDIKYVKKTKDQLFTPNQSDEGVFSNKVKNQTKVSLGGGLRNILPYMFCMTGAGAAVNQAGQFTGVAGSVWIPHTIESIGNNAFYDCDKLAGLTMGYDGTTNLPSIGTGVFDDCEKFSYIKVRKNQLSKFQASDMWNPYEGKLVTSDDFQ